MTGSERQELQVIFLKAHILAFGLATEEMTEPPWNGKDRCLVGTWGGLGELNNAKEDSSLSGGKVSG